VASIHAGIFLMLRIFNWPVLGALVMVAWVDSPTWDRLQPRARRCLARALPAPARPSPER
jgi:hypothetical protein